MEINQKIIDYSIRYYLKYYPSPKKLALKLKQKFGPDSEKGKKYGGIFQEEIDYIIGKKLKNIILEENVIKSKIKNYQNKGKSKLYIKQKMFERLENKYLINKYLDIYFLNGEIDNIKKSLKKMGYSDDLKYNEKQKILKKLIIRGFKYDEIKQVINN